MTDKNDITQYLSSLGKKSWAARQAKYGEVAVREQLSRAGKQRWSAPEGQLQRERRDRRIHRLRETGQSMRAIAATEGVSTMVVQRALQKLGDPKKKALTGR